MNWRLQFVDCDLEIFLTTEITEADHLAVMADQLSELYWLLGHVAGCHVSTPALYEYYAEPVCNQGLLPGYAEVKYEGIDHGLRTLLDYMTTSY